MMTIYICVWAKPLKNNIYSMYILKSVILSCWKYVNKSYIEEIPHDLKNINPS